MSPALKKICENTHTTNDFHRRLGLLQECLEEVLYHDDAHADINSRITLGVAHAQKVGTSEDAQALEEWGVAVWSLFQIRNVVAVITKIKEEGELLPVLTLYIPVAFDTQGTKLVSVWCRENINPQILLELVVDSKVTGGCAFVLNDTYHDFSLRHAVEQNKGIVTQLLSSYV